MDYPQLFELTKQIIKLTKNKPSKIRKPKDLMRRLTKDGSKLCQKHLQFLQNNLEYDFHLESVSNSNLQCTMPTRGVPLWL